MVVSLVTGFVTGELGFESLLEEVVFRIVVLLPCFRVVGSQGLEGTGQTSGLDNLS